MNDAAPVQQHQQQQQQQQLPQHQQQQQIRSPLEQQQLQHYQLQQQQHQQQHQEKPEAAASAAASALPAVSEAHSSQGVPSHQQAKLSHNVQQPATAPKASSATQVNANATATMPRPGPQASAQPSVGLKQPPPKKEKIPCLFCTKPARSTCPFKLCKKCCNERHPNDCKAHDSGPAANSVKPADKPKNVKPQAVPVAPVEAVASAVHTTAHQLPAPVGPPELTPVTAGPDTFDLTKTVADFHKERAAVTEWQSHVQLGLEKQRHDAVSQACDRYTENAQLMKLLCCNDEPDSSSADANLADIKRRKLWLAEAAADESSQAITGDLNSDGQSSGLSATPAGLPVRTTCFVL